MDFRHAWWSGRRATPGTLASIPRTDAPPRGAPGDGRSARRGRIPYSCTKARRSAGGTGSRTRRRRVDHGQPDATVVPLNRAEVEQLWALTTTSSPRGSCPGLPSTGPNRARTPRRRTRTPSRVVPSCPSGGRTATMAGAASHGGSANARTGRVSVSWRIRGQERGASASDGTVPLYQRASLSSKPRSEIPAETFSLGKAKGSGAPGWNHPPSMRSPPRKPTRSATLAHCSRVRPYG